MPEEYEIKVKGLLDDAWGAYFPGMQLTRLESGDTLLAGSLPDQAALHKALRHIRDLNIPLLSVACRSYMEGSKIHPADVSSGENL